MVIWKPVLNSAGGAGYFWGALFLQKKRLIVPFQDNILVIFYFINQAIIVMYDEYQCPL